MASRRLFVAVSLCIALAFGNSVNIPIMNDFFQQSSTFTAGASKIDATLPVGTPLAGYNHGQRRYSWWPLINPGEYTTWMTPSTGAIDGTMVKALVLDNGVTKICMVTIDAIGADDNLNQMAYDIAVESGFNVPYDNCLFSGSHSHSGPGAISSDFLWSIAPATDLLVPELQRMLANSVAQAMVEAMNNSVPASMDIGTTQMIGVTANRRAKISPYVNAGTIDPHCGVIRVDDANGKAIATVWNFAIHGVCYGPENLQFSGDIMGKACTEIEEAVGGVAMFINADAGDVDPAPTMCDGTPNFKGSQIMATTVVNYRATLSPVSTGIEMNAFSTVIPFGPTNLNATLGRLDNCTHGGPLDICTFCEFLKCDINAHLSSNWIQNTPRFTAFSFVINGISTVTVSLPGEGLVELGWWIRNDTLDMGFNQTFLTGYSNNHMGYFATPDEYDIGGYESQLTLWGIETASMIRNGAKTAAKAVIPDFMK